MAWHHFCWWYCWALVVPFYGRPIGVHRWAKFKAISWTVTFLCSASYQLHTRVMRNLSSEKECTPMGSSWHVVLSCHFMVDPYGRTDGRNLKPFQGPSDMFVFCVMPVAHKSYAKPFSCQGIHLYGFTMTRSVIMSFYGRPIGVYRRAKFQKISS